MEVLRQMNLRLVTQHEKLHHSLNDHLGRTVLFVYTTSPWDLDLSREGSIVLSNGEYVTGPVQETFPINCSNPYSASWGPCLGGVSSLTAYLSTAVSCSVLWRREGPLCCCQDEGSEGLTA